MLYKLWDEKIHGRKSFIELGLGPTNSFKRRLDLEANISAADRSSEPTLPPHLFPESKAIVEKRRIYLRNLPYGTTEDNLRDLLKGFPMYIVSLLVCLCHFN